MKNIVSMSGGKDSTAMALLAIERDTEDLEFVFADTGHEHEMTYEYCSTCIDRLVCFRYFRQTIINSIRHFCRPEILKTDFWGSE